MKKIIMSLIPDSWWMEVYMKGRREAGASVIDASHWFSREKIIYETMNKIGQQIVDNGWPHPESVRTEIYDKYQIKG